MGWGKGQKCIRQVNMRNRSPSRWACIDVWTWSVHLSQAYTQFQFYFVLVYVLGLVCVYELRPPKGILFIPQVIYISMESHGGMISTRKNRKTWKKSCPSATTNLTYTDPETNPRLRCKRPAANSPSNDTTYYCILVKIHFHSFNSESIVWSVLSLFLISTLRTSYC
jgi:hypothetical protein